MILQEPLLVVGTFFVLFTLVILLVRIDFSLAQSKNVSRQLSSAIYQKAIIFIFLIFFKGAPKEGLKESV